MPCKIHQNVGRKSVSILFAKKVRSSHFVCLHEAAANFNKNEEKHLFQDRFHQHLLSRTRYEKYLFWQATNGWNTANGAQN